MSKKILSIFVDESGDFGTFCAHSPYYLVTLLFHEQNIDISHNIKLLDEHLRNLGCSLHNIHIGPLIRRESVYRNDLRKDRKKLFSALFNFTRKIDFRYTYTVIKKNECNFYSLFSNVEFRKVKPAEYKLFQVADLICTMELLAQKTENKSFTHSEIEFFGGIRDFKKNYYKWIKKKLLS